MLVVVFTDLPHIFKAASVAGSRSQTQRCIETVSEAPIPALDDNCQWYDALWNSAGNFATRYSQTPLTLRLSENSFGNWILSKSIRSQLCPEGGVLKFAFVRRTALLTSQ